MEIAVVINENAVKASSEKLSESLLDVLPGLNIGEAVIVGNLSRAPVMIKVRRRNTQQGGADIDVVGLLAEAREVMINNKTECARFTFIFSGFKISRNLF